MGAAESLRREAPNAQFVFLSERGACGPSPGEILSGVLQSGHNVCSFAQYVEKLLDSLRRAGDYFDREAPMRGD